MSDSKYRVVIEDVVVAEYVVDADSEEQAEQYALLTHTTAENPGAVATDWQITEREVTAHKEEGNA